MAKNVINEKGFKIIALSPNECDEIGFGVYFVKNGNHYWELVCDNCNKLLNKEEEVYYILALNRIFDKECLKDWYASATYHQEDAYYEAIKHEMLIANLKANNIVIEEHTKKIL